MKLNEQRLIATVELLQRRYMLSESVEEKQELNEFFKNLGKKALEKWGPKAWNTIKNAFNFKAHPVKATYNTATTGLAASEVHDKVFHDDDWLNLDFWNSGQVDKIGTDINIDPSQNPQTIGFRFGLTDDEYNNLPMDAKQQLMDTAEGWDSQRNQGSPIAPALSLAAGVGVPLIASKLFSNKKKKQEKDEADQKAQAIPQTEGKINEIVPLATAIPVVGGTLGLGTIGTGVGLQNRLNKGREQAWPDYLQGYEGWIPDYLQGKEGWIPDYFQNRPIETQRIGHRNNPNYPTKFDSRPRTAGNLTDEEVEEGLSAEKLTQKFQKKIQKYNQKIEAEKKKYADELEKQQKGVESSPEPSNEGFAGVLPSNERKAFDSNRRRQSEVLGYKLTGKSDIKVEVDDATIHQRGHKMNESLKNNVRKLILKEKFGDYADHSDVVGFGQYADHSDVVPYGQYADHSNVVGWGRPNAESSFVNTRPDQESLTGWYDDREADNWEGYGETDVFGNQGQPEVDASKPDWSSAPGVGTDERRAFYDKYNLAYDDTINQSTPPSDEPVVTTPTDFDSELNNINKDLETPEDDGPELKPSSHDGDAIDKWSDTRQDRRDAGKFVLGNPDHNIDVAQDKVRNLKKNVKTTIDKGLDKRKQNIDQGKYTLGAPLHNLNKLTGGRIDLRPKWMRNKK